MDIERIIKRLLVIIAVSLLIILVAKVLLGRAFSNLSKAAEKKQQAASARQTTIPQAPAPAVASLGTETPVTASMPEIAGPAAENPVAP